MGLLLLDSEDPNTASGSLQAQAASVSAAGAPIASLSGTIQAAAASLVGSGYVGPGVSGTASLVASAASLAASDGSEFITVHNLTNDPPPFASQSSSFYQGTHQIEKLTIAKGSSGLVAADVIASSYAISKRGTVRVSKALASMAVAEDSTNVYITLVLFPADTSSLVGTYDLVWSVSLSGFDDVRAIGTRTIYASASV